MGTVTDLQKYKSRKQEIESLMNTRRLQARQYNKYTESETPHFAPDPRFYVLLIIIVLFFFYVATSP